MAAIYRPTEAISLLRPCLFLPRIHPTLQRAPRVSRAALTTRHAQATQSRSTSSSSSSSPTPTSQSPPPRKSITLTGDTGRVRWSDLSPGEKVVRTTQQSVNLVVVVVGVLATCSIAYLLFSDVVSPSSKTAHFNRATGLIRADPRCQKLLGPGPQIAAHGEASWSRWARNRYITSARETDRWGTEHMRLRFYVEGPLGRGVVDVHLAKGVGQSEFDYVKLVVDVEGRGRVDLVAEEKDRVAPKIFGARWW